MKKSRSRKYKQDIGEQIMILFLSLRSQIKVFHWQSETYAMHKSLDKLNEDIVWANQLKRTVVVSESGWSFGDQTEFNSWIQYPFSKQVSVSSRLKLIDQDALSGRNALIMAPVQTANPKNYGGTEAFLGLGMNINFDGGSWVSSGIYNSTTVEGNNLVKSNFTWFGKCFELTEKQFKKPLNNGKFEIEKS